MLYSQDLNLRTPYKAPKLQAKRIGPFKILEKLSPVLYKLDLPPTMSLKTCWFFRTK
jgi:hypothetical protein